MILKPYTSYYLPAKDVRISDGLMRIGGEVGENQEGGLQ